MSDKDNITPALNLNDQNLSELSAEEFQRRLYTWFEDRGLLSDLRAHMRLQMINALKDTSIGKPAASQAMSPKLQAINLLIAEFLLHQDCHYSLSIFSAEVPAINVLPEFSSYVINGGAKPSTDTFKKWRFTEKDMWDILETLGFIKESDEAVEIVKRYYDKSNDECLLMCVIRMMHQALRRKESGTDNNREPCISFGRYASNTVTVINGNAVDDIMFSDLIDILTHCNLHPSTIQQIIERVQAVLRADRERTAIEQREAAAKLEAKLSEEVRKQEESYQRKLERKRAAFELQQEKFREEHAKKQKQCENYAAVLRTQSLTLRKRCEEALAKEQALQERETELDRREAEIAEKERFFAMAIKKQSNTHPVKESEPVSDSPRQNGNHPDEADAKRENTAQQTKEDHHNIEDVILKGVVKQLEVENTNLRTLTDEQTLQIQEITRRATGLLREVEYLRSRLGPLRNYNYYRGISLGPTLGPAGARPRVSASSTNGGGEEGFRPFTIPPPTNNRVSRDLRCNRRTGRPSHSSDDQDSDDVLRETKNRLRQLERESHQIDKNFKNYCNKRKTVDERKDKKKDAYEWPMDPTTYFQMLFDSDEPFKKSVEAAKSNTAEEKHCARNTTMKLEDPEDFLENNLPTTSQGYHGLNLSNIRLQPFSQSLHRSDVERGEIQQKGSEQQRNEDNRSTSGQSGSSAILFHENLSGISDVQLDSHDSDSSISAESQK